MELSKTTKQASGTAPGKLTVYYDGACPLCSREIGFYHGVAAQRLSIGWMLPYRQFIGPDPMRSKALARFHVRLPDGTLESGRAASARWGRYAWFRLAGIGRPVPCRTRAMKPSIELSWCRGARAAARSKPQAARGYRWLERELRSDHAGKPAQ